MAKRKYGRKRYYIDEKQSRSVTNCYEWAAEILAAVIAVVLIFTLFSVLSRSAVLPCTQIITAAIS